jgi:acyl carrier protein
MELQKFIEYFTEQFDDTDASEITATTAFHDLEEWSSLTAMGVIAFVKTEYGKTITGKEMKECVTVEDLFNLISSK